MIIIRFQIILNQASFLKTIFFSYYNQTRFWKLLKNNTKTINNNNLTRSDIIVPNIVHPHIQARVDVLLPPHSIGVSVVQKTLLWEKECLNNYKFNVYLFNSLIYWLYKILYYKNQFLKPICFLFHFFMLIIDDRWQYFF